jgi:transcriptional regulator with XRE-family HTH domain
MANLDVRHLGDYIRTQRRDSNVSLRQLAKLAGVSNPYLSQIERGLRKPSAEILQQIAKALRISAEALYVQAGILEQREGSGVVADAILADDGLNERQKQVLLEIYDSFRKENAANAAASTSADAPAGAAEPLATEPAPAKAAPRRTAAKTTPAKKTTATKATPTKATAKRTATDKASGGTA